MVIDMKKRNLIIGRAIFTLAIIILFGLIIMKEKGAQIFAPKVKQKFSSYVENNYNKQKNHFITNDITYKDNKFQMKIVSKNNKHLYFYLTYTNGDINDTYQKDYKEGKTLLTYLNKKLSKNIYKKTQQKCSVHNISKLNQYTKKVQTKIIDEDNLLKLKYYYVEKEISIDKWTSDEIVNQINNFIIKTESQDITPNYYSFIFTNNTDITDSIKISHIKNDFPKNTNNKLIINDIINKNKSDILMQSNIKYEYLNEEE